MRRRRLRRWRRGRWMWRLQLTADATVNGSIEVLMPRSRTKHCRSSNDDAHDAARGIGYSIAIVGRIRGCSFNRPRLRAAYRASASQHQPFFQ